MTQSEILKAGLLQKGFISDYKLLYEQRGEKTGLRGFRRGPTQTGMYNTEDG